MTVDLRLPVKLRTWLDFGDRERVAGELGRTEENMKEWIKNPEKYKPGNIMTGTVEARITDSEINALHSFTYL